MSTEPENVKGKLLYAQLFTVDVVTHETHMRIWGPMTLDEYLEAEDSITRTQGDQPVQEVILPAENAQEVHDYNMEKHVVMGRD